MVAHADAQTGTHPKQEKRGIKCVPTKYKECSDRAEVEEAKSDAIGPVDFSRVSNIDPAGVQGVS
jgi:hypothetical protein